MPRATEAASDSQHADSRARWFVLASLSISALAADQLSKYLVEHRTQPGSIRVLVPGVLNLMHTSNPGVAFGILADSANPWRAPLLIVFSLFVIALLVWLLVTGRAGARLGECGIALILGGAVGNVFDRLVRRSVTDFIDFHVGSHHWYTFNLADSAIVIGAFLVILELFRDRAHPTQESE
ncbi:MAG: signal peptidase II [Candidatus Acidiferrales bacterium]|jgi:signal peptidase II